MGWFKQARYERQAAKQAASLSPLLGRMEQEIRDRERWVASLPWQAMLAAVRELSPVAGVEWHAGGKPFDIIDESRWQPHLRSVFPQPVGGVLPAVVRVGHGDSLTVFVMGGVAGAVEGPKAQALMGQVAEVEGRGVLLACRAFLTSSPKGSISVRLDLDM